MIADIRNENRKIIVQESSMTFITNNVQINSGTNNTFSFDFFNNLISNVMEKLGM